MSLLRVVWDRSAELNVFFLAGAVAFNVILAAVPFLFLLLALAGFLLPLVDDPVAAVASFILGAVPNTSASGGPIEVVERVVGGLVRDRRGVSLLGAVLFVWFSTRLVGAVRTVLRQIFEIPSAKGILVGKLFDAGVVVLGTILITVNLGLSVLLTAWGSEGFAALGLADRTLSFLQTSLVTVAGFTTIGVLALLVYRFLADGKVPWGTAIRAAVLLAVAHEVLKMAFGWYATSIASYRSVYGTLANLAVLLFWVYYTAIAFVLAGVVAHEWESRSRAGAATT